MQKLHKAHAVGRERLEQKKIHGQRNPISDYLGTYGESMFWVASTV